MKIYKHYIIYKITNLINGKIYIGKHKCDNLDDNYFGSGKRLWQAINKYGIENFNYEILEEIADGESQEFINEREKYFIQYYHSLKDELGYNVTIGGDGCPKPPLSYEEKLERSKLFNKEEIQDIQKRST